jgi:PPOX class probable F420-dependent enzyme
MTVLAPDVIDFLRESNVASLATTRPNGRPHVTPVWYEYDGREFVISSLRTTQKMKNIARKGFAALCIYSQEMPYRQVLIEGTARVASPVDNVWRERVATRYLGETAGRAYVRESGDWDVVAIHIRPVRWMTEGFSTS